MTSPSVVPQEPLSRVSHLRISYVSTRVHDRLGGIGKPGAFAKAFVSLPEISGVALSLPFTPDDPVNLRFWSALYTGSAERQIALPIQQQAARLMLKRGVPLRHAASLSVDGGAPVTSARLEAHLRPFSIVAFSTIDLVWDDPVLLAEACGIVNDLGSRGARLGVGGQERDATMSSATDVAADLLVEMLAEPGGTTWQHGTHRVATVIKGDFDPLPAAMPAAGDDIHGALNRLALGESGLPDPVDAFVAQWNGATFGWAPTDLVYMLAPGTSILSPEKAANPPPNPRSALGARHRRAVLVLTFLTSAIELIRAAAEVDYDLFDAWSGWMANAVGRLYAPNIANFEWGLEARAYVRRANALGVVGAARGGDLTEGLPAPGWPGAPAPPAEG